MIGMSEKTWCGGASYYSIIVDFVDNLNINLDCNQHLKAKVKLQKLGIYCTVSRDIPSQFPF